MMYQVMDFTVLTSYDELAKAHPNNVFITFTVLK